MRYDRSSTKESKAVLYQLQMAISLFPGGKLQQFQDQISLWKECTENALEQLSSLSNLASQLEVLSKGKLGVLREQRSISNRLETKLLKSMENALQRVLEQKYEKEKNWPPFANLISLLDYRNSMGRIVQKMKRCCRDERVLFEKAVDDHGLESCCTRNATSFSLGEHCQWLQMLYISYRADFEEKCLALEDLSYSVDVIHGALEVWRRKPVNVHGKSVWDKMVVATGSVSCCIGTSLLRKDGN